MRNARTARLSKLYHTAKMLRPEQVLYRIYYRFAKIKPFTATGISKNTSFDLANPPRWSSSRITGDGQFDFMGSKAPIDWSNNTLPKIWLYNLHYLDHLGSRQENPPALLETDLVNSWIHANPPFNGCGWEPYTLSLRIVNLIKWFQLQPQLDPRWLESLAMQSHALSQQIEYHILANHLFVNGKALVFAGSFMLGDQAESWLKTGLKILDGEIKEQFLADGAHYELSPMYHASLLWDMCDLMNLALNTPISTLKSRVIEWQKVVERGIIWLRSMQHPDGGIPFFNDSAFGIAPTLRDIESYAGLLGCQPPAEIIGASSVSAKCHSESGYAEIDFGKGSKALLNFAQIAPDYQPGHTHADTLSFELSIFCQRVFVNSGTSQYGEDSERHRQRSTAAHNTVEIDGENSSEVWAGFRVARRAHVSLNTFESSGGSVRIRCSHDGYKRLKGRNLHTREWTASMNTLQISDIVTGTFEKSIARFHIHPDATVTKNDRNLMITLASGDVVSVSILGAARITIADTTWHPEFGKSVPNQCIVAELSSDTLMTSVTW
ncbi:alginate lyase family protein [Pseudomonas sp. PCH199]|uniref:heparinase II/III family protein n=1 Tax=unclassified Pseudomonas TaxID=196821 RepID=UPI000BC5CE88|nr:MULTISPECIES: heparinase II/III family protein [unclassified Pseudomonas]MCW8276808.1 alginate lyase family protein [Pseudomonas sp. PCH199]PAM83089.1 heparinase [Pseudomonas sp. ERMR1:02]